MAEPPTIDAQTPLIDATLAYAKAGWFVFPTPPTDIKNPGSLTPTAGSDTYGGLKDIPLKCFTQEDPGLSAGNLAETYAYRKAI